MISFKNIFLLILFMILLDIPAIACNETIHIITDRDLYVSGEKVLFNVFVKDNAVAAVCVEMVNPTGKHIVGAVIPVKKQRACGYLAIPDALSSGTYFIKTSLGPIPQKAFLLKDFHVINRFQMNPNEYGFENPEFEKPPYYPLKVEITGLKEKYMQREEVSITLHFIDKHLETLKDEVFIAVTEKAAKCKTGSEFIGDISSCDDNVNQSGIIYSGKVVNKHTGAPQKNTVVYLTIDDSIPYFDYCTTGSTGKFSFILNDFYGALNLSMGVLSDSFVNMKIIPDNNYSTESNLDLTQKEIIISKEVEEELLRFQKMVISKKAFRIEEYEVTSNKRIPDFPYPYYGRSAYKVYPEQYVTLKNFAEISRELLPGVRFRESNGNKSLRVVNQTTNAYFESPPFLLLNNIPLNTTSMISNLGTNEIERIEVLPEERFFGDLKFEGVVALYTTDFVKQATLSKNNTMNVRLEGLQNHIHLKEELPDKKYIPDFRQVLHWGQETKQDDKVSLQFRTSDVIGDYLLQIYAQANNGEMYCFCRTINVVKK